MSKTDTVNVNLSSYFSELKRCEENGDFDKGIKICKKILNIEPDNVKAIHCEIVCKIHLGLFDEAINQIEKSSISKSLQMEKAYCEYRLNKLEKCIETLKNIPDADFKVKELMAQALYRLEKYEECYKIYKELIKNSDDEYEDERETNLSAVISQIDNTNHLTDLADTQNQISEKTYELSYNKACIEINNSNYSNALIKLNKAEELCKKTFEEEGADEEEIESELSLIRTQMGFVYQKQKNDTLASKMYTQVLKQKPTDISLIAVASNNIVTLNKEQNVFDSRKKMKAAMNENLETRLNSSQKRLIIYNNCLLLLQTNQSDSCRKQIKEFKTKFSNCQSDALMLETALLCKEKRYNDAINILKSIKSNNKQLNINLLLIQLLLNQGLVNEALMKLTELDEATNKLAVISSLVALYLHLEDKDSAVNCLKRAIAWYKKEKPSSSEIGTLYRETGRILLQNNRIEEAIKLLEELRSSNPSNPKILAQLISAYSQFDPRKAKEVSKDLPPIENVISEDDINLLETSNWSLGAKYVKKTKVDQSPVVREKDKKKKHKKKKILPKNYDATVDPDPERWLPRWQRSTYKKKKDKRGYQSIGKGTQGAVAGDVEINSKPSPKPGVTNTASPQQGPRLQRPTQKKKKSSRKH